MALLAILKSLDGLSDEIKAHYKQLDGGYQLDVTEADGLQLANVAKLQSALSKERENARSAGEKLKSFDGLDATAARDALKKVGEMANWSDEEKVKEQIESVKKQMAAAHGEELKKLTEKVKLLTSSLEEARIDAVATQALAEHKGSVKLLMPHIRSQSRLREADGRFVVEVVGSDGTPRLSGTEGHPMTIADLVKEMKGQDDFASAFEGTGATGTGATGSNGHKGRRVQLDELAKLPPAQRMQKAQEMGITK